MIPEPTPPTLAELYGRIRAKSLTDEDQRLLDSYLSGSKKRPFLSTPVEIDTYLRLHSSRLLGRMAPFGATEEERSRVRDTLEWELSNLLHDLRPEMYPPPEA